MSRGVRRILVTVLVGLLGLAVGFTSGFAVGLLDRSVDASWLEAVGTWVGAGIILIAVIPLSGSRSSLRSSRSVETTDIRFRMTNESSAPNRTHFYAMPIS
jgi:hypothetical protein